MKKFKFGVCEWCLNATGPEALKAASKAGFDGIQIGDFGGRSTNFRQLDPQVIDTYLNFKAELGIEIPSLHTHFLTREGGMKYPCGTSQYKDALESYKKAVEVCKKLDIPVLLLASFAASGIENDEDIKNTAYSLSEYSRIADDNGISLAYEGVTDIEKVYRIIDGSGGKVKLCYDIYNPLRFHYADPAEELGKIDFSLIDHIHLKDAPASNVGCSCLGEGATDNFKKCAHIINDKGYSGWLIAETYYYQEPLSSLNADELMKKDISTMRDTFNNI